jgi:hypothetical protein
MGHTTPTCCVGLICAPKISSKRGTAKITLFSVLQIHASPVSLFRKTLSGAFRPSMGWRAVGFTVMAVELASEKITTRSPLPGPAVAGVETSAT